jgi:hypothetical protein
LLAATTLAAIGAAFWGHYVEPYRRERKVAELVERLGGTVTTETSGPEWLQRIMGPENTRVVTGISLRSEEKWSRAISAAPWRRRMLSVQDIALLRTAVHARSLDLGRWLVTDYDLGQLLSLEAMEHLDLAYTSITDAGARRLPALRNLRSLRLQGTRITDASLAALARVQKLEVLVLHGTRVTRAGIEAMPRVRPFEIHCLQVRFVRIISDADCPGYLRDEKERSPCPCEVCEFSFENIGTEDATFNNGGSRWGLHRALVFQMQQEGISLRELGNGADSDYGWYLRPGRRTLQQEVVSFQPNEKPRQWGPFLATWPWERLPASEPVLCDLPLLLTTSPGE